MTLKDCGGSARQAEETFGWGRARVKTALGENRTGILCWSAKPTFTGNRCWEEQHPEAAGDVRRMAEAPAQQDPTFRSTLAFTRLTAAEACRPLRALGHPQDVVPPARTIARMLNRLGYRLRRMVKAKPLKKIPETDVICADVKENDDAHPAMGAKRISVDGQATVKRGDLSRGGRTRGNPRACDPDRV